MTAAATKQKWTEERVSQLTEIVGAESPISNNTVVAASTMLDATVMSIAAKLRKMGHEVVSLAKSRTVTFSDEQGVALQTFVEANKGLLNYREIGEQFADGSFSAKQVQGKLLSMQLTSLVKATEQVAAVSVYTQDEEATFIEMANSGAFLEDIATALGFKTNSVRGKALSLYTKGAIAKIPTQRTSTAKNASDPYDDLGDAIATMTVAEIALAVDKTDRGVKTTLTRRGIAVSDYDGAAKHAKALAKASTEV